MMVDASAAGTYTYHKNRKAFELGRAREHPQPRGGPYRFLCAADSAQAGLPRRKLCPESPVYGTTHTVC